MWLNREWEPNTADALLLIIKDMENKATLRHIFLSLFLREGERECMHIPTEKGRERGRGKIPSRFRAVSAEPQVGLDLMNQEVMT